MANTMLGMSKTYNSSSLPQRAAVQSSIPFIEQAIDAFDITSNQSSPLIIADYGSSHGLNSIYAMKTIIEYFRKIKKDTREVLVIHNDLPTNDWSSLFQLLINNDSYNGVACGRSFYEQCLPNNTLSIGYSSISLHWLSKKPCNISDHIYIGYAHDPVEREAFKQQAHLDYYQFLQHRSCELLPGGVLILAILGRTDQGKNGHDDLMQLLYECAQSLPLTSQELVDFTLPLYFRSYQECIDEELFSKCSFEHIKSEIISVKSPLMKQWEEGQMTLTEFVRSSTSFVRGWAESVLEQTLINNDRVKEDIPQLLERVWDLYEQKFEQRTDAFINVPTVFLVLKKK